jgi:tRNA pseudouridine(55) synthase
MNGILLIDKPDGLTSADVVRRIKRCSPRGAKVGHLGTLRSLRHRPAAALPGRGTKIAQFLNTADKRYRGLIQLGAATDTGDRTGTVVRRRGRPDRLDTRSRRSAQRFIGEIRQRPPMYSAIKKDGVPLYRLARQGIEIEREERPVRITQITWSRPGRRSCASTSPARRAPTSGCSRKTSARVGDGAHLGELRRTPFGDFTIDQPCPSRLRIPPQPRGLVALRAAVAHLPASLWIAHSVQAVAPGQERGARASGRCERDPRRPWSTRRASRRRRRARARPMALWTRTRTRLYTVNVPWYQTRLNKTEEMMGVALARKQELVEQFRHTRLTPGRLKSRSRC